MNSLIKNSAYLVNGLFFIAISLAHFFEVWISFVLSIIGFLLNMFYCYKWFLSKQVLNVPNIDESNELNLSEKDKIMEDLDREATRRRESEKFTKN